MSRRPDLRLWAPLWAGLALFAWREASRPAPEPEPPPARATSLPLPALVAQSSKPQRYELLPARSTVRFRVDHGDDTGLWTCAGVRGRLELDPDPTRCVLELQLDLATLEPAGTGTTALDLAHLLGVNRHGEVTYRATLQTTTQAPLPGLLHRVWLGSLYFGNRVVRQPMAVWQCAMPAQPLRLQGHGPVAWHTYGLPHRRLLGLFEENYGVSLGLDLAWQRSTNR